MVYEDEIPVKLKVGESYSATEILRYMQFNNGIVISTDTPIFFSYDTKKYKVVKCYNGYIHYGKDNRTYVTPPKKENIYIVEVDD